MKDALGKAVRITRQQAIEPIAGEVRSRLQRVLAAV